MGELKEEEEALIRHISEMLVEWEASDELASAFARRLLDFFNGSIKDRFKNRNQLIG
jgi:hypothetical protein